MSGESICISFDKITNLFLRTESQPLVFSAVKLSQRRNKTYLCFPSSNFQSQKTAVVDKHMLLGESILEYHRYCGHSPKDLGQLGCLPSVHLEINLVPYNRDYIKPSGSMLLLSVQVWFPNSVQGWSFEVCKVISIYFFSFFLSPIFY